MPAKLEAKLKRQYANLPEEERDHAVYGTMNKLGLMHGSKVVKDTDKKNAIQRKALGY